MHKHVFVMLLSIGLVLTICHMISYNAYGQGPAILITAKTDKIKYSDGDTITISGHIDDLLLKQSSSPAVLVQVYNPNHVLYLSKSVDVNKNDGTYLYPFKIEGNLGITGSYDYTVSDGPLIGNAFTYTASPQTIPEFSFALPMLLVGITSLVLLYRIKFKIV